MGANRTRTNAAGGGRREPKLANNDTDRLETGDDHRDEKAPKQQHGGH